MIKQSGNVEERDRAKGCTASKMWSVEHNETPQPRSSTTGGKQELYSQTKKFHHDKIWMDQQKTETLCYN